MFYNSDFAHPLTTWNIDKDCNVISMLSGSKSEQLQVNSNKAGNIYPESSKAQPIAMLDTALSRAADNDGLWLNEEKFVSPTIFASEIATLPAFTELHMMLDTQENNYSTNVYIMSSDVDEKKEGATEVTANVGDKFAPQVESLINIDNTNIVEDKNTLEDMVKRSHREGSENIPISSLSKYESLKKSNPDREYLFRDGNFFETYNESAEKIGAVLNLKPMTDEKSDVKNLRIPASQMVSIISKIANAGLRLEINESRYLTIDNTPKYDTEATRFLKQTASDMGIRLDKATYMPTMYNTKDDSISLHVNNLVGTKPNEYTTREIADMYRALVDATNKPDRLDRSHRLGLKSEDTLKYNALITELSAGVLMMRQGLPAYISEDNMPLIPYWQRELRENPHMTRILTNNVNAAVEAILLHNEGLFVNYHALRENEKNETKGKEQYSIVNELAAIPNASKLHIVTIRDHSTNSAIVILPQGASTEVNNEVKGMEKANIRTALSKEGFKDVSFYNADGYLSLNQPNEYFQNKSISEEKISGTSLYPVKTIDVDKEIERTSKPIISNILPIRSDEGKFELYIKATSGKTITIVPSDEDLRALFDSYSMTDARVANAKRDTIAQKYYNIAINNPDLQTATLHPSAPAEIKAKISDVSVTKDTNGKPIIIGYTDGKELAPKSISIDQYQRFRLSDDQQDFKKSIAANAYAQELGVKVEKGQSQPEPSFQNQEESHKEDRHTSYRR